MRHLARLQDAINDRYSRITDADAATIDHQITLTRDWINAQPELRTILTEAEQVEPNLKFEVWLGSMKESEYFGWPGRTEAGRASMVWKLMKHIAAERAAGVAYQIPNYCKRFKDTAANAKPSVRLKNDYLVQEFAKQIFRPFFRYLSDQVGLGSAVVHVLQRYVARVEWYDRDELHRRYEEAVAAKHVGEDVYNLDLQRFLFLDGGYITQAKARSASGEADLIGGLDTDDPLICEAKLYDRRGKPYLAQGFHQVIKYAHDYNKTVAHLVVFNLTEKLLQFQTDGPAGAWAPYIEHANVRVHLIVVRAVPPTTTASKSGKSNTVVISREDLVTLDHETNHEATDHETPTGSGN